jgi:hypothetical protein
MPRRLAILAGFFDLRGAAGDEEAPPAEGDTA